MRWRAVAVPCALAVMSGAMTAASAHVAPPSDQASAHRPAASRYVLAISVDGLNPRALTRQPRRTPSFHRLIAGGAATLNARSARELTDTLPNHTGMITSRRIDERFGGHGIWVNGDPGGTVQEAAGHPVASVFTVVRNHGRRTALFASKEKFALFPRSWPRAIGRYTHRHANTELVDAVRRDLVAHPRALTFLHLSLPDRVGHARGFMSRAYLRAVRNTDRRLGEILRTVRSHPRLRRHLAIVLTADHGGFGRGGHSAAKQIANYRVPFIVWGAGVPRGTSLYRLNRGFHDPGHKRPRYVVRPQPIRNVDLADMVTSLLGLPRVPASRLRVQHGVSVR